MKEKKIYIYIYMRASAYNVISKEVENRVFRKNRIFRHKLRISNPHRQSSGVI